MSELAVYPGTQIEVEAFNRIQETRLASGVAAGSTTITVYDASRWTAGGGDVLKIGDGDPQTEPVELVTTGSVSGNVVTLSAALNWRHVARTPVARLSDSTMAGTVEKPDGTTSALTLNKISTGRYRATHTTASADAGENTIEITASVTVVATESSGFRVLTDLV